MRFAWPPFAATSTKAIKLCTLLQVEAELDSDVLAGRYRITGELGSGTTSTVWRAMDPKLNRPVAIKVLRRHLVDDESFRGRMEQEARLIASLQSPNIVSIFESGWCEAGPYLVMELVAGPSLRGLLSQSGPLPIEVVESLASDLLEALTQAHHRGLIHRDIKPANVLLTSEGVAKLTDFGITRALDGTRVHTIPGTFLGTVAYSSPEQLEGREIGPQTDLYSLACVLYECLLGAPPFIEGDVGRIAIQQRFADPVPISERRPETPEPFALAIMRGLAKDPAERFASAAEMAEALGLHQTGDLIQAVPRTAVAPRHRRLLAWILGGVALIALAAGGLILAELDRESSPASLIAGHELRPGQSLVSPNDKYQLTMRATGALILTVASTGEPLWSSGTTGHHHAYATVQADGNFVIYPRGASAPAPGEPTDALFSTLTQAGPDAQLNLLNDGDVVLMAGHRTLWQSGSGPRLLGSQLRVHEGLHPQQMLQSPNGRYSLIDDGWTGKLELLEGGCRLWQTPTRGVPASVAVLESTGNLVLYAPVSREVWSSETALGPDAEIILTDSGSLTLSDGSTDAWQAPLPTSHRSCSG
jgi:hypothetical protein